MTRCANCYQALYESDFIGEVPDGTGIPGYYCPLCEMDTPEGYEVFDSPAETRFWLAWCEVMGGRYPYFLRPQHWVAGDGYRFRLDFAYPEIKLNTEIDGQASHTSSEDRVKDRRRDALLERDGWRIIRFTGSQVWRDAGQCARTALKFAGLQLGSRYGSVVA